MTNKTRPAPKPLVISETERSRITYTRRIGYELSFDGVHAGTFDTMEQAETERDRRLAQERARIPTAGEPIINYALQYDDSDHRYQVAAQIDGGPWQTLAPRGWSYAEAEQIAEQYTFEWLQAWRRGEAVQG